MPKEAEISKFLERRGLKHETNTYSGIILARATKGNNYSTVHMSRISMDLINNEVGELVPYPKAKVKPIAWKHFKFKKDKNG